MIPVVVLAGAVMLQSTVASSGAGGDPALAAERAAPRDSWIGADKLKHFFVAAFTQSVAYSALQAAGVRHDRALAGAWAVTAAASVAKELHDLRASGLFSVRDLVWDAAGAGAASVLLANSRRRPVSPDPAPSGVAARAAFQGLRPLDSPRGALPGMRTRGLTR